MKLVKRIFSIVLGIIAFFIFYIALAYFLSIIPANSDAEKHKSGVQIFIKSNGVHADLVLPMKDSLFDWSTKIDTSIFVKETKAIKYVALGWGDKGFYLDTPTWADLKVSTALYTMFWPSPTAMHVTLKTDELVEGELTKRIFLTKTQYQTLLNHILASFQQTPDRKLMAINCCHYNGANDMFYEANGSYHLFYTCNSWTNEALKVTGLKTAFWTPSDKGIFCHFK